MDLPGGPNDNAVEKARYQIMMMQKYLEDFRKHKDYINKVKRFKHLTPLQKMKIREA